jgi:hypothetical protein
MLGSFLTFCLVAKRFDKEPTIPPFFYLCNFLTRLDMIAACVYQVCTGNKAVR